MTIKSGISQIKGAVIAIALLASLCGASSGAFAQTQEQIRMPVDRVVEALQAMGFEVEHMSRTWLGRIRIEASNGTVSRELIVNRVTGEVLRDYWEDDHDDDHNDRDDDGDDDDDRDDDDDDGDDD